VAVSDFEKGFRPRISRDVSIDYHPSPSCGAACAAAWPMMNRSSPKTKSKCLHYAQLKVERLERCLLLNVFNLFYTFLLLLETRESNTGCTSCR